jgi:hypothetical protein
MNVRQPRYSNEEMARRGPEWYRSAIQPKLGPEFKGKYVAIDVDTGDYEIADQRLIAAHALIARHPEAQIWMERIGHRAVISFGGQPTEEPE